MIPPNIVVILADDLGFSDLASFGGELSTPNLDRLAGGGVRMSNFYATPRCSPSRASLLTGHHPHDVGIGVLTSDDRPSGYPGSIDPAVPTIAELLRDGGYRTGLSGKWHLAADVHEPNPSWPTRRGFDDFYGILAGCGSYFQPRTLYRGESRIDEEAFTPDFYFTDSVTDHAIEFVQDSAGDPFFLYLAYTAPHWPLHATEEDIQRQAGRFAEGWDVLRQQRLERMVSLGILPEGTRPAPRDPGEPPWEEVTDSTWEQRRMETYAAQVEAMDRGIGRLIDRLDELGKLENTLIVFLSDNGACAEVIPTVPPGGFLTEDVCPSQTRAGNPVRVGNNPSIAPGAEDTYSSYGRAWANLSNAPLRRYKRWVHEGGISSPLIAHWPAGGLASGTVCSTPAQLVDLLPTILQVAGISAGEKPLEGSSILAYWRSDGDDTLPQRDVALFWEHIGNAAVRLGDLKLVREEAGPWELYDLSVDRTELDDLASARPRDVALLAAAWDDWAARVGVLPWQDVVDIYARRGQPAEAARG